MYNRQLHDQEREWAKKSAKQFAAAYEEKTGRAITDEKAESLLLGTGYMMVDDKARVGPGYDMAAAQYIAENSGGLFKATAAERADVGPLGGPLTPEQLALPGHEAHPEIGMAAGAGVGLFALGTVAPTAATAWALSTAYDYAGDVISGRMGLSTDEPKIGKSLVIGGVASAASPFFLPLKTLGGSTIGKIVVGAYNSVLAGTTAFGSTAITGSGSADLSAGVGAGSYMLGTAMTTMLPGPLGNYLYQFNQILSGPAQNAITNTVNKKEKK